MKHALRLLTLLFCFMVPAYAQSGLSNFSVSGSAIGFMASGGTQAAVLSGANYQLTSRVQVGYWNLSVPAIASYNFGVAGYALPLSSVIGKSLASKLNFDASAVQVGFSGGVGRVTQGSPISINRLAEIIGANLSFPVTSTLTFHAVQFYYVHGGLSGTSGSFVTPDITTLGMGISVNLDSLGPAFKHRLVNHKKATVRLGRCLECQ